MAEMKTVDDLKHKLIQKIIAAESDGHTDRYISATVRGLNKRGVNPHIIARFIDKLLFSLRTMESTTTEAKTIVKIQYALLQIETIRKVLHKKDAADHVQTKNN